MDSNNADYIFVNGVFIMSTQDTQPTSKQYELGHTLVIGAIKGVTEENNVTLDLAFSLFTGTGRYAEAQKAVAFLWCTGSGDYAEQAARNDYIHDLCIDFGKTSYTSLIDIRNGISKSPESTKSNPDYASHSDQIKAVQNRMKDAVRVLAGLMFLQNNGNENISVKKSPVSVHKFVQCEDATGIFHKYNKSGILEISPKSTETESNTRKTKESNARKQGLEYAIMGINEAIRNEKDRSIKKLSEFKSKTLQSMLVDLYQSLNEMMVNQDSLIDQYIADNKKIEEVLKGSKQTA